jgi:hypothetical protein
MKLFFDKVTYFAVIYDNAGKLMGKKELEEFEPTFTFLGHEFITDLNCKTFMKLPIMFGPILKGFYKYFYYNYDNPTPIELSKGVNPIQPTLTAKELYVFIHTKKMEELNELAQDNGFLAMLMKLLKSPIFWILLVAGIGLLWYLQTHGWKLW